MDRARAAAPALAVIVLAGFGAGASPSFAAPPAGASAGWSAATVVEPETVEEVPAALVRHSSGLVLAIAREPGGERVMGILRLAPADQDFLDETRAPVLRLDDGPRFEGSD